MPDRILVGIDGSLASRAAVIWALERARSIRTGVVLLIVVDDEWGAVGERAIAELRETAEGVAVRELEFARERAGSVEVTAAIAVGAPMLVLASEASAFESVVIGTHKVGTFHGHALGSRGLQLAAVSPVPTMVVPGRRVARAQRRRGRGGGCPGLDGRAAIRDAGGHPPRGAPDCSSAPRARRCIEEQALLEIAWDLPEAADLFAGIVVRRSPAGPGETLAGVSRRAVLTVSGRPTAPGARGFRPLGRANSDLLMNAGGPVAIVPFVSGAERATSPASLVRISVPTGAE